MTINLNDIAPGVTCIVAEIVGDGLTAQRVRELGITIGSELVVVRKAPFKGPIDVATRNGRIAIRTGSDVQILVTA